MALVNVERVQRKRIPSDPQSPLMFYVRQMSNDSKVYDIERVATEIESIGSLSVEDVKHVILSFVRSMNKVLRDGNRVKIDGLGTFYITFRCPGVEKMEDCTIKSVQGINIRFKVDKTLRLVNDSNATTRSAPNNVQLNLITPKPTTPPTPDGGGEEGGEEESGIDPRTETV